MEALVAFLFTISVALLIFAISCLKKQKNSEAKELNLAKNICYLEEIITKLKLNLKDSINAMQTLEEQRKNAKNRATILQIRNTKLKLENDNLKKLQKAKDDNTQN